ESTASAISKGISPSNAIPTQHGGRAIMPTRSLPSWRQSSKVRRASVTSLVDLVVVPSCALRMHACNTPGIGVPEPDAPPCRVTVSMQIALRTIAAQTPFPASAQPAEPVRRRPTRDVSDHAGGMHAHETVESIAAHCVAAMQALTLID